MVARNRAAGTTRPVPLLRPPVRRVVALVLASAAALLATGPSAPARAADGGDAGGDAVARKSDRFLRQKMKGKPQQGWSHLIVKVDPNHGDPRAASRDLKAMGASVYRALPFIDSAAVSVPNKHVERLAALPWVRRLSTDIEVEKTDDFTVGSSGADVAFSQYSLTGQNVGVAVVDSGINHVDDLRDQPSSWNSRVRAQVNFTSEGTLDDTCGPRHPRRRNHRRQRRRIDRQRQLQNVLRHRPPRQPGQRQGPQLQGPRRRQRRRRRHPVGDRQPRRLQHPGDEPVARPRRGRELRHGPAVPGRRAGVESGHRGRLRRRQRRAPDRAARPRHPAGHPQHRDGAAGRVLPGQSFNTFSFSRIDPSVAFDFTSDWPDASWGNNNYSVRWSGQVQAPVSGNYTFTTYPTTACACGSTASSSSTTGPCTRRPTTAAPRSP
jgi:hypothetical protein